MKRKRAIGWGLAAIAATGIAVFLAGWQQEPSASLGITGAGNIGAGEGANPRNRELVAQGQGIYQQHCATCHGADGEGQPDWQQRLPNGRMPAPPHDSSGHTWHHPDPQLFLMVKKGVAALAPPGYQSDMPGYGGILSDREIFAVLAYIKSRWPQDILLRQEARTTAVLVTGG